MGYYMDEFFRVDYPNIKKHMDNIIQSQETGTKQQSEQGISKELTIGLATSEIICRFTEETLNKLDVKAGDKVIIQIRKAN